MRKGLELTQTSRTTLRDLIGVAELKIIDEECYDVTLKKIIKEQQTSEKSLC
jgi:uncharacterized protein YnzC (UPF0291/DUF896 family)